MLKKFIVRLKSRVNNFVMPELPVRMEVAEPKNITEALIELDGASAYSNDRNRPYLGQPHTDEGVRGTQKIRGLTMRDVRDCFIKGALLSNGVDQPMLYDKAEKGTWLKDDIYELDWSSIDPIAVAQNMACEIEKMMGIFPNVPKLKTKGITAEITSV